MYVFFSFFTTKQKKKTTKKKKSKNEKEKENSKDFNYIETTHLSRDDHRGMVTFWQAYL